VRLALVLAALVLAGCASQAPAARHETENATAAIPAYNLTRENVTVPPAEIQNATLGGEHVHDLWKGREQIVLLDATVQAGLCEGPSDAALQLAQEVLAEGGAADGCARLFLPDGVVVPEGTGDLEVSADASAAMKGTGGMELNFRDKAREGTAEPTTDATHVWHLNLTEADWDLPHANATTWVLYVQGHGSATLLDGDVHARIVAHRIPGWQPILAVAHVDHWKLPHLHDFAAPDVMRLFAGNLSVTNIDPARLQGQNLPQTYPLQDIVAPGAKWITLVVDDKSSDCAPVLECHLVPALVVGGFERERFGNMTFHDGARRVYTFAVPTEVPEDSVYANRSTTQIDPRIEGCVAGADESSCGVASIASTTVTARVLVLAWHGDVDNALLKKIAG
jgi:hypothetical protein